MTEAEEHANFIAWLKKNGLAYTHSRTDKRSNIQKGHPDFEVHEGGRTMFIEMKVLGGKISKDQEKRIAELRAVGMPVRIAFSSTDAICYTEHWRHMPMQGHPSRPLDAQGITAGYVHIPQKGKADVR